MLQDLQLSINKYQKSKTSQGKMERSGSRKEPGKRHDATENHNRNQNDWIYDVEEEIHELLFIDGDTKHQENSQKCCSFLKIIIWIAWKFWHCQQLYLIGVK